MKTQWLQGVVLFLALLPACAEAPTVADEVPSAGDVRAYHLPLLTLELAGTGLQDYEGKTVHVRVVDPVTQEVRRDTMTVQAGAFERQWVEFYKPDRTGYVVDWFIDLDGDGQCGQDTEPMWRGLAQKDVEAPDTETIRVELGTGTHRADRCAEFNAP